MDDRHVEIYNSSQEIIKMTLKVLEGLINKDRIKIEIFTKDCKVPFNFGNFHVRLRKPNSPWNFNKPKIKIRVSSKDLVKVLEREMKYPRDIEDYLKGLFDAEASVDINGRIEFKQKDSEKGRFITERAFQFFKILEIKCTNIKFKRDNRNNKTDIYFYVTDLEKYKRFVGFTDQEKIDKLNILISVRNNTEKLTLPKITRSMSKWEVMKKYRIPYWKLRRALS